MLSRVVDAKGRRELRDLFFLDGLPSGTRGRTGTRPPPRVDKAEAWELLLRPPPFLPPPRLLLRPRRAKRFAVLKVYLTRRQFRLARGERTAPAEAGGLRGDEFAGRDIALTGEAVMPHKKELPLPKLGS